MVVDNVVHYTASTHPRTVPRTLAALRDFAARQGWNPTREVYDLAPPHIPARQRTGWRTVERLLTTGQVTGLVAPAELR
ncbi:hypothetical protein AB0L50_24705 [Streptomyces flaveolus]|uniref:hypothetical protein n=1 Tax=Streptomyces flaveolus TaxID=67297 RepID=UPI003434F5C0